MAVAGDYDQDADLLRWLHQSLNKDDVPGASYMGPSSWNKCGTWWYIYDEGELRCFIAESEARYYVGMSREELVYLLAKRFSWITNRDELARDILLHTGLPEAVNALFTACERFDIQFPIEDKK